MYLTVMKVLIVSHFTACPGFLLYVVQHFDSESYNNHAQVLFLHIKCVHSFSASWCVDGDAYELRRDNHVTSSVTSWYFVIADGDAQGRRTTVTW